MMRSTCYLRKLDVSRPFQRLVQCSLQPNASEILRADFETTFKGPLAEVKDPANFLHRYCVKAEEVVPYTTTMMRVFTDLGALEDMRLIFAMAINELHQSVPEELYRIYLFSISETDTFTRDEVMNVLSLAHNTGVQLSLISKLCILDLMLKLGLDPIEHIGSVAADYNGQISSEDVELLLKKCDSLLNTVLLTHYNAHWATEMFSLCAKFHIAVAERVVEQVFKLCLSEPSLHPIHVIKGAWVILNNPNAATLRVSDEDLIRAAVRCRQWKSLEGLQTLQKLLMAHGRYTGNAEIEQVFTIVAMNILAEQGRATDAIRLLPLLEGTNDAYSHYPCVALNSSVTVADTHPSYFLAASLAQQGTAAIDAAYYGLTNTGGKESDPLSQKDEGAISAGGDDDSSTPSSSFVDRGGIASTTTAMMDVILAACSAIGDEVRALETFNVYPTFGIVYSSESFLHVMSSMSRVESAVQWHRQAMAIAIAHEVTPSAELLRLMLSQSLECDDVENALWVIKLNRIFGRPLDRHLLMRLCVKISAAHDAEAAHFLVKVVSETATHIDDRVMGDFKHSFGMV